MTVHKLHAGDGYVYLTRHVAVGDTTEQSKSKIVDYYNAKGTPPGQWFGALTAAAGVRSGEQVTEDQMIQVFGGAWRPNRGADLAALAEQHRRNPDRWELSANASRAAALGRPFSAFDNSSELVQEVLRHSAEHKAAHGEYPDAAISLTLKREVATAILTRTTPKSLLTVEETDRFIAEAYSKVRRPVAGYDLVFTPVKSISAIWGLGDARMKEAVERAHREAVDETLAYIEDKVIYTRRGAGGANQVKADGLLVARFDHWDNRASDPNLHTHCAVVNRVMAKGTWTSIDGRVLYKAAVSASETYNTLVMDKVARLLGVTFGPRSDTLTKRHPVYEVQGVPLSLIEEFSRRAQIEARQAELAEIYRAQHGKNPPKRTQYAHAQRATLDTRNSKNPPRSLAELRAEWRSRAQKVIAAGHVHETLLDLDPLTTVGSAGDRRPRFHRDAVGDLARMTADRLSREAGTWTRYTIVAQVQRTLRAYSFASPEDLHQASEQISDLVQDTLSRPIHVERHAAPPTIAEQISDTHHRLESEEYATIKYTSEQVLEACDYMRTAAATDSELAISTTAIRRHVQLVQNRTRRESGPDDFALSDDQLAMVDHFLQSRTLVAVAVGAAGSGKSTAAEVVARAWESTGAKVIALGPSAQAAEVLGDRLAVTGRTIAHVLTCAENGLPTGISTGDMLLVDEAAMASARDLADLTALAESSGAVVRLLGDPQQLAAVESSGVLRDLAELTNAPFLSRVHRFVNPEEAQISLALRAGSADVVDWYADNDRIKSAMKHQLPEQLFADYAADIAAGTVAIMIAPTREMVGALNERAALHYRSTGHVSGPETELSDGSRAAAGDIVVSRRNTSEFPVKRPGRKNSRVRNGDLWTITTVHPDGALTLINNANSGHVYLPSSYVHDHVELGYASTIHRAQGLTVQVSRVMADQHAMDRQGLYVAMSRGTESNVVYVPDDALPDYDFEHRPDPHPDHIQVLQTIIERDGSEETALVQLERAAALDRSLPEQIRNYLHAVTALYDTYTRTQLSRRLTPQQLAFVVESDGWSQVVKLIAAAETRGQPSREMLDHAARALKQAGAQQQFDEDDNTPAKVLAGALRAARPQTRYRRDDPLMVLNVPAVSSAAAVADEELAAYARGLGRRMLADVHAGAAAVENAPPSWVESLPDPGSDPRRAAIHHELITRVTAHRLARGIELDEPDIMAGLPVSGAVSKLIATLEDPTPAQRTFAAMSDKDLARSTKAAHARVAQSKQMVRLLESALTEAQQRPREAFARTHLTEIVQRGQDVKTAQAEISDAELIAAGTSDPATVAAARDSAAAAVAAAPALADWEAAQFAAETLDEQYHRIDRACELDSELVETATAALARATTALRLNRRHAAVLDSETQLRGSGTTDAQLGTDLNAGPAL
ncbi:MobF family relaxase [Nocardia sp. NPDC060249]|uniref:MobF family relaxase n=1 Tax=Nocardia sp. NPDC060249 TaxID=3347082 RepID=UPI0036648E87